MRRLISLIALALILGCNCEANYSGKVYKTDKVYTIEHDGHKFVLVTSSHTASAAGIGILHHPDCPCLHK